MSNRSARTVNNNLPITSTCDGVSVMLRRRLSANSPFTLEPKFDGVGATETVCPTQSVAT
jgi:hypothetical protein